MKRQRWQEWGVVVDGIWVFLSLGVIAYFIDVPAGTVLVAWSHYLVGLAIILMGVAALVGHQFWAEWVDLILGVWLVFLHRSSSPRSIDCGS